MDSNDIVACNDHSSKMRIEAVNNEVSKAVVAEVVNNIVDLVCKGCISFDYFFDRFSITDPTSFRIARDTKDERRSEDAFAVQLSGDNSDDEFDRILESTRRQTWLQQEEESDELEVATSTKISAKFIEHEYDTMPAIDELRIHVEDDILLKKFGRIVNIVDRLVVIESDSNTALDFETVIFDAERNAVGRVFDIFGPVAKPMYAILFNDIKDASKWRVGSEMYYAPTVSAFTHTIFTEKEKLTDGCWDGEGECPDDMLAFSDDEAEQRYKAKHRFVKVGDRNEHMFDDSPRSKKARFLSKHGQLKFGKKKHNIAWQSRSGLQQYDVSVMDSSVKQHRTQQSSFWSAAVNESGLRQYQPNLGLASCGMLENSNHQFLGRNTNSRQYLSSYSFVNKKMLYDSALPRTDRISLQNMSSLPSQRTTSISSFNNHHLNVFTNPRRS